MKLLKTPISSDMTPGEPFDGYLVLQGAVPETREFLAKVLI